MMAGMAITAFSVSLTARFHEVDIAGVAVKALTEEGHHRLNQKKTGNI
ncbi:hypothetical protein J7E52_18220 [Bacillus sp. ISL-34]|nr:hypothetical protein [Bacillus sp. ISL-34]